MAAFKRPRQVVPQTLAAEDRDRQDPAVRAAGAAGRPGLTAAARRGEAPRRSATCPRSRSARRRPTTRTVDQLDYRLEPGPPGDERPPLVFLHEGLGSVELWRTFPDQVRAATGGPTTLVYSRAGYGRSSPIERPWPVGYMHREALEVLPEVLARLGLERPVLIGHSDGASIALLHAGSGHPVAGLVLHGARTSSSRTSPSPGSPRPARRTRRPGCGSGWPATTTTSTACSGAGTTSGCRAEFRQWNIEPVLPGIDVPVLAIQGDADDYGTLAQLDAIEAGVRGPFERLVVPGGGHVLHTGDAAALVAVVARFVRSLP